MGNTATTDRRRAFVDDADDYVVVDQRRIILDLPDVASISAKSPDRDARPVVSLRGPLVRVSQDDLREH